MTKPNININSIMTALKAKEADASRILQSRDAIIIEKSADELDEIEGAVAREIAIRNLDRESGLLREIRSALRRIDAAHLACVCLARKGSAGGAWRRCPGRDCAYSVRKPPTQAITESLRQSRSGLPRQHDFRVPLLPLRNFTFGTDE